VSLRFGGLTDNNILITHSPFLFRPFRCPNAACGKHFSVLSNLRRHLRVCSGKPATRSEASSPQPENAQAQSVSDHEDAATSGESASSDSDSNDGAAGPPNPILSESVNEAGLVPPLTHIKRKASLTPLARQEIPKQTASFPGGNEDKEPSGLDALIAACSTIERGAGPAM
jgi:hypothetical protein